MNNQQEQQREDYRTTSTFNLTQQHPDIYKRTADIQSELFKRGVSWHNTFADECCPDFSCCLHKDQEVKTLQEQLIKACKYGYEFHTTTSFPELSFNEGCKNNFLQRLQAQSAAHFKTPSEVWIGVSPVTLPEFDTHVLVFCRIYGRYLARYTRIDPDYNFGEWRDFNNKICLPPTHWMYLPEKPKQ